MLMLDFYHKKVYNTIVMFNAERIVHPLSVKRPSRQDRRKEVPQASIFQLGKDVSSLTRSSAWHQHPDGYSYKHAVIAPLPKRWRVAPVEEMRILGQIGAHAAMLNNGRKPSEPIEFDPIATAQATVELREATQDPKRKHDIHLIFPAIAPPPPPAPEPDLPEGHYYI